MSKYVKEFVEKKLPHLVVHYTRGETPDKDIFGWQFGGELPRGGLIGYIVRVQAELAFRNPDLSDDVNCVIAWNGKRWMWFVHSSIPVDDLVGVLEVIKAQLVQGQLAVLAQMQSKQRDTGLIGPNGQPILR